MTMTTLMGDHPSIPKVDVAVPWALGMTEREFFNANLACGQLPAERHGGRSAGCGAKDWHVWRAPWMLDSQEQGRERELKCLGCGASTYVLVIP